MRESINISNKRVYEKCKKANNRLLDVRTAPEWAQGIAQDSVCLNLADIDTHALEKLDKDKNYYVICQTGQRSLTAIIKLRALGFKKLFNVHEGYVKWKAQDLPIQIPKLNSQAIRYSRHHQLQGFGKKAQDELLKSHVLLIGAGGLGSSAALYLAAAGIGTITLIDDDVVSLSNLQRQVIHTTECIDNLKVESAKKQLIALNPEIIINSIAKKVTIENAQRIISQVDIVIDGSDNLSTRYLVNDVCLKLKKPLVYAAVFQYESQLTTFDFRNEDSPCLRCLFPQTEGFEPENCSTVGVLGVVPGLAGIIQASEAIKLITCVGETLIRKLQIIDLYDNSFKSINYKKDTNCQHH